MKDMEQAKGPLGDSHKDKRVGYKLTSKLRVTKKGLDACTELSEAIKKCGA